MGFFFAGGELVRGRERNFVRMFVDELCIDGIILFMAAAAHHNMIITNPSFPPCSLPLPLLPCPFKMDIKSKQGIDSQV